MKEIERILIRVPLVNANDNEVFITEYNFRVGDPVNLGDILGVLETTKTTFELDAEQNGFFFPLIPEGTYCKVGDPLIILSNTAEDTIDFVKSWMKEYVIEFKKEQTETAERKKITKKAKMLCARYNLDIEELLFLYSYLDEEIVENHINQSLAETFNSQPSIQEQSVLTPDKERILVIGGGGGFLQLLDAIDSNPDNQEVIGIFDDNNDLKDTNIMGIPVFGSIDLDNIKRMYQKNKFDSAIIAVSSSIPFRKKIFKELKGNGIPFANIIHSTAYVAKNAKLGEGNIILANCHIGTFATIGDNNFLSAYIDIEHHCSLGDHCSFGPSVYFSALVQVNDEVRFGTGIVVEPNIKIGKNSIIASGVTLTNHISSHSLVRNLSDISIKSIHDPKKI